MSQHPLSRQRRKGKGAIQIVAENRELQRSRNKQQGFQIQRKALGNGTTECQMQKNFLNKRCRFGQCRSDSASGLASIACQSWEHADWQSLTTNNADDLAFFSL